MTEHVPDADAAVADVPDGATVLIGGFGTVGQPMELIDAVRRKGGRRAHRRRHPTPATATTGLGV